MYWICITIHGLGTHTLYLLQLMCFFIYGGRDQTCPEVHPGTAFRARPDNTSAHARQRSGPGPPGSVDVAMS